MELTLSTHVRYEKGKALRMDTCTPYEVQRIRRTVGGEVKIAHGVRVPLMRIDNQVTKIHVSMIAFNTSYILRIYI